jgi:hypothetical protein
MTRTLPTVFPLCLGTRLLKGTRAHALCHISAAPDFTRNSGNLTKAAQGKWQHAAWPASCHPQDVDPYLYLQTPVIAPPPSPPRPPQRTCIVLWAMCASQKRCCGDSLSLGPFTSTSLAVLCEGRHSSRSGRPPVTDRSTAHGDIHTSTMVVTRKSE